MKKTNASRRGRENLLITLDQINQTIEVLQQTVNRLTSEARKAFNADDGAGAAALENSDETAIHEQCTHAGSPEQLH